MTQDARTAPAALLGEGQLRELREWIDAVLCHAAAVPEVSRREAEVLRLIAPGHSNKEIAARLKLSIKTVETYKLRSVGKLGLRGRVAIVRYAAARGWLGDAPAPGRPGEAATCPAPARPV